LPHHVFLTPGRMDVDLGNRSALTDHVRSQQADILVNCVAYTNVDGAEDEPDSAYVVNGTYAANLAEASAQTGIPIVHFSTDYEFDGMKSEGYAESDATNPISAYGCSKALGSKLVAKNNPRHYIVRTSRLYGLPGSSPQAKSSFVDLILDQASREKSFEVNDGEITGPTLVDDLVRHLDTHILSSVQPIPPPPGLYHIANTGGATWYAWAKAIVEIAGLPNEIRPRVPTARPAKRPAHSILLSTKIPPMRPWREALEEYLTSDNHPHVPSSHRTWP